ncbi:MAG TPA: hypothetical protein VEW03_03655 [Longimicrobiaceae bacterium]|nr:hypothetical protein [Longimicrobiaceae bacterium]
MPNVDRLLRWVWLINGILLLGMLVLGVTFVAGAWITDLVSGDAGVAVEPRAPAGEARPRAVRYDQPSAIRGTDARILLIRHGRGFQAPSGSSSGYDDRDRSPIVNVAFLDAAGGRLLLNRPAFLSSVRWPHEPDASGMQPDTLLRLVVYDMALEDGNRDGRLDHRDPASLYVSDLDGRNLRRVLPAGMRVRDWRAMADGSLLVTALDAAVEGSSADEMPQRAFMVGGDGRARPYLALDSVAAAAGRVLRN